MFEEVTTYYQTPVIEINSEDYPDFKGSTKEEFIDFLNENLYDLEDLEMER